jgi:hypothetical protein
VSTSKVFSATLISICFLVSSSLLRGVFDSNGVQLTPTMTEASGGLIGSGVDELRCPNNLNGVGPTWNNITIGVSSLNDLSEIFSHSETFVTPYPPYAGNFAPNYQFGNGENGYIYACIVEGKVAALLIDRHSAANSSIPMTVEQWVSFLGAPKVVSWHQQVDMRILHWPQYGISVTVEIPAGITTYGDTEWVYFYPFRGEDYEELWPINSIWIIPPFPFETTKIPLNILDFEAIEMTATAERAWPTRTPQPEATPSINLVDTPSTVSP